MSRIKVMSRELASRIAAGEVVERPGSVVKELVENSIDAGATKISVTVEKAGSRLISVIDNGCGMDEEDAKLAFEEHGTSKLSTTSTAGQGMRKSPGDSILLPANTSPVWLWK